VGKIKYSLDSPPDVFVRKALESSDSEGEDTLHTAKPNNKQRRYKLNGKRSRKPHLTNDDFPELK
jgi:hypothetical protein